MGAERSGRHLVIFARRPAYGVGKRRLAAEIGDLAAWRFQRFALAALLRELAADPRWMTWLAITPDRPTRWARAARVIAQGQGDLGRRLTELMRRLPGGAVVVLGSDAPQVTRQDVAAAFHRLGPCDAAFGPAVDGGFWLVGVSRRGRRRAPFQAVRWSTAHALTDTLDNLRGRPVGFLRRLEDVDDAASLRRVGGARLGSVDEVPDPEAG
jgi:glycosyltransferase A (GT-A) superfamily protein (DUF2064 family)